MVLPIFAAILFLFTTPSWVGAHAELESSNPSAGTVIALMPQSISLNFGEELISLEGEEVNTISLSGPTGADIPLAPSVVDGAILSSEVEDPANSAFEPGEYKISYRVVSADGHPISGSISFILKPDQSAPTDSDSTQSKSEITSVTGQNTPSTSGNTSLILIATLVFLAIGSFFIIRKK
jgi:methionine-rich copper-binding protein CopC